MPLVTRFADRGSFFRQATEPSNWLNGDLWVDTDNANLAVNNSGSDIPLGLGTLGSALEVLRVNGAGNALEYGVVQTTPNLFCGQPSGTALNDGDTKFSLPIGVTGFSTTETDKVIVVPLAGTWSRLVFNVSANTLTTTLTIISRDDAVDGNQVITYLTTATGVVQDVTNTDTVDSLSQLDYELSAPAGAGTATIRETSTQYS